MRYQFQANPGQLSYKPQLFTDAIKLLVSVNFTIFFLQTISGKEHLLFDLFGLVPQAIWSDFMIWQPFTYLFFHGNIWHILINMFVLWMFGSELENSWGRKNFIKYYFITGIGAGMVTCLFNLQSNIPVVGASGAVYGILLAYGLSFPNRTVYLYGLIPIKSIWFVIAIGILAFLSSFQQMTQISHLTHISGMAIGYVFLKRRWRLNDIWFKIRKKTLEYRIQIEDVKQSKKKVLEKDIDHILDKIQKVGFKGLSDQEQNKLYNASKTLSKFKKKD
ncbi:MAG: rhomboid family intramembrane serine protease [Candidatus Neomarinimicrobiota bacterium]|jgi:membrane associated rhomboid family serine protease|nr:MAG: rhomboid family intramembrane serine protease [Candidatus Neomarinimicrobiota bacterium]